MGDNKKTLVDILLQNTKDRVGRTVIEPLNQLIDANVSDIVTTIGSFVVRSVRGKFQRSISFTIGSNYYETWMEEALYAILYQYNDIKKSSKLELTNNNRLAKGDGLYYRLDDGTHNLKYRNYDILLVIQTVQSQAARQIRPNRIYTIITYNLDMDFVKSFERDMVNNRNSFMKVKGDSPTISVYKDAHEGDGWTYWDKLSPITKRRLATIYVPDETKRQLIDLVNSFFHNKQQYVKYGIPHNLTILLEGPPGPQPLNITIPTPNGVRKFGDLRVGDQVYNLYHKPTKIVEMYEYRYLDEYEVEMIDGRTVRCGGDHKWPIVTAEGHDVELSTLEMLAMLNNEQHCEIISSIYPDTNVILRNIVKCISKINTGITMRCIHIDDDTHIYLTTDYIPTCNSGKDSIAKMIASEWNRNLYYCTGGKDGKFIPNALIDADDSIINPLYLISDVDKYPFLINEPTVNLNDDKSQEEKSKNKMIFNNMINALDGVMTPDGRIVVMTTNHIESFSPTILRPGRVDLVLHIGYVTNEVFRKYVKDFYNVDIPDDINVADNVTVAMMQADAVFMKMTVNEFVAKYTKSGKGKKK